LEARADFMGITFSMDALKAANVIFNDYEGKDVIRKKASSFIEEVYHCV